MDLAGICSSRTRFDSEDEPSEKCGRTSGCTSDRRNPSPKYLFLILLVAIMTVAVAAQDDSDDYAADAQDNLVEENGVGAQSSIYDSRSRDFTARCLRLAQYSGPKACEVFMACCSEDNVLNKLNGDRCQRADPSNGCTPNYQGEGIRWSLCRAYNCTEEVTTTTTTTTPSPVATAAAPPSSPRLTLVASGFAVISALVMLFIAGTSTTM